MICWETLIIESLVDLPLYRTNTRPTHRYLGQMTEDKSRTKLRFEFGKTINSVHKICSGRGGRLTPISLRQNESNMPSSLRFEFKHGKHQSWKSKSHKTSCKFSVDNLCWMSRFFFSFFFGLVCAHILQEYIKTSSEIRGWPGSKPESVLLLFVSIS